MDEKTIARFWAKVDKRGPDECWEWTGARKPAGYGHMRCDDPGGYAHRVSYEISRGHKPCGVVMHSCDNPPCVNPSHLADGSHSDNTRDAIAKGRDGSVGIRNRNSVLNDDAVRRIRAARESGVPLHAIAKQEGISNAVASYVAQRKAWRHVA